MDKKYYLTFSVGVTLLSIVVMLGLFHWSDTLGALKTERLFYITLVSFLIGAVFSIVLFLLARRSDFNLSSIGILVFVSSLYLTVGNIPLGGVFIGFLVISFMLSLLVVLIISTLLYIFLLR